MQLPGFATIDPTKIDGLAGKYENGFGTPFDLSVLENEPLVDIHLITHLRLTDVVGNIDPSFATYDQDGQPINDPWPTPFPSGGFDLDAVGVIHQNTSTAVALPNVNHDIRVSPNPAWPGAQLQITGIADVEQIRVFNSAGQLITAMDNVEPNHRVDTSYWPEGMYIMQVISTDGSHWSGQVLICF
jgi:hypothetical protein